MKSTSKCIVNLFKHVGILKNMREVHKKYVGQLSASHTSWEFLEILKCLYNSRIHKYEVFYFFLWNAKEIAPLKLML